MIPPVRPSAIQIAIFSLLILVLLVGGGNLYATYDQNHALKQAITAQNAASKKAAEQVDQRLCSSFGQLAALPPPPGSALTNPSRGYEQKQHDILVGLGADVGCPKG